MRNCRIPSQLRQEVLRLSKDVPVKIKISALLEVSLSHLILSSTELRIEAPKDDEISTLQMSLNQISDLYHNTFALPGPTQLAFGRMIMPIFEQRQANCVR